MFVQTEEEAWLNHIEKEINRSRLKTPHSQKVPLAYSWHNFEEGPQNISSHEYYQNLKAKKTDIIGIKKNMSNNNQEPPILSPPKPLPSSHRLWPEIEEVVAEQIDNASLDSNEWKQCVQDGDLSIFMKSQTDLSRLNPVKAVQVVQGFTGHEMCHYFFSPQYRTEWETTLEEMKVVETISVDTLIFHQTHKRMWPISQRDAVFWSHIRELPNKENLNQPSIWIVVNNSTDHVDCPADDKRIRLSLRVCLFCQTEVNHPKDGSRVSRDDIVCKITYCSVIDPGGWAPSAVLRAVGRREYPRFLKKFVAYVKNQTKDEPIMY